MFGKKRTIAEECASCSGPVRHGQKVCGCGKATSFMDFDERRQYEVEQWRRYREQAAVSG